MISDVLPLFALVPFQDFINVSFLEAGSNTKTLGVLPTTTAQDLCAQCADKFEVLEPEFYRYNLLTLCP